MDNISGCPLVFNCPACNQEVTPNQMLISRTRTLVVLAFCEDCQANVCYQFNILWLYTAMENAFALPTPPAIAPATFTPQDFDFLTALRIKDEERE